jgi:hypothetical protein
MIQQRMDSNWQSEDRRPEPAILLTVVLGLAIATFLATVM